MKPLSRALAVALLILAVGVPAAAGATIIEPERDIMSLVNQARAARGLAPLRTDSRLWALAGERAAAMAARDVLSHDAAGSLADGLRSKGIEWYGYGEVIAYSRGSAGAAGQALFDLWASSPPHWTLLMSTTFNYLGVGVATSSSGRVFGSIALTESRDRTGAQARMVRRTVSGGDVRWSWRGWDPVLQTHTAGLRDYTVQLRRDRGAWVTIASGTTSTSRTTANLAGGHAYGLRVRARDRAGNVGPWSAELRAWVP